MFYSTLGITKPFCKCIIENQERVTHTNIFFYCTHLLIVYMYVWSALATACVWRSADNLSQFFLSTCGF